MGGAEPPHTSPVEGREVVALRLRLEVRPHALPDGGNAGGDGHPLGRDEAGERLGSQEPVGHRLLRAEHHRGEWQPPAHRVEHRHHRARGVRGAEAHGVRHRLRHGVQVGRAVGVHHPLRVAGGAARVAKPEGGVLVELRPLDRVAVTADELLVVDRVRKRGLPPVRARLAAHDEALHARNGRGERFEHGEEVRVQENDAVPGMVDDVLEVPGPEAHVQGMQHGADRRHRVVELQVPPAVPHEARDPVPERDPEVEEAVRELAGAAAGVGVRLAMGAARGEGDHLLVGCEPGAAVEQPRHQERGSLHRHVAVRPAAVPRPGQCIHGRRVKPSGPPPGRPGRSTLPGDRRVAGPSPLSPGR